MFDLFKGPYWTLLTYGDVSATSRPGLQVHAIGVHGDLADDFGHFQAAYGVMAGDRVLVGPDGYVGAIVSGSEDAPLDEYLTKVGLIAM